MKTVLGILGLVCAFAVMVTAQMNFETTVSGTAGERYRDEIFNSVTVKHDIPYGEAPNIQTGQPEILLLDLYQPEGDTEHRRPVMIWIHGGGFRGLKDKTNEFIVTLANRFAMRGYVTASIEYRVYGQAAPEAAIIASEDARAAIRWFRANAAAYRIDTTRISIGGKSAGAFTSLYATYSEHEGNSGNPGHSSEVSACVEMAGALIDLTVMDPQEAPLLIIHGTNDESIPFTSALMLESRAKEAGIHYEFHPIQGAGHDLSPYMNDLVRWASEFLYKFVINGGVTVPVELASFSARFVSGAVRLEWTTATETNNLGFAIERQASDDSWQQIAFVPGHGTTTEPQAYEYAEESLPAGAYSYRLKQIDADGTFSYSTIVSIQVVPPQAIHLLQNYPNPLVLSGAANGTSIQYTLATESEAKLNIFNALGQLVRHFDLGSQPAGYYDLVWEGKDERGQHVSQGVYYYQLHAGEKTVTRKMVVF